MWEAKRCRAAPAEERMTWIPSLLSHAAWAISRGPRRVRPWSSIAARILQPIMRTCRGMRQLTARRWLGAEWRTLPLDLRHIGWRTGSWTMTTRGRPSTARKVDRSLAYAAARARSAKSAAQRSLDAILDTVGASHGPSVAPLGVTSAIAQDLEVGWVVLCRVALIPPPLAPPSPLTLATLVLLHPLAVTAAHCEAARWLGDDGVTGKQFMKRPVDQSARGWAEMLMAAANYLTAQRRTAGTTLLLTRARRGCSSCQGGRRSP